jgi:hypothetical protein
MTANPAPSDADLILAVLERDDRPAFAELVRRHQFTTTVSPRA